MKRRSLSRKRTHDPKHCSSIDEPEKPSNDAAQQLLRELHSRPGAAAFPLPPRSTDWRAVFSAASVRVSLEDAKKTAASRLRRPGRPMEKDRPKAEGGRLAAEDPSSLSTIAAFQSVRRGDNLLLNAGAPVWALTFSPPCEGYSVLAVGTCPWSRAVTRREGESHKGPGAIQLWKVPKDDTAAASFAIGLLHNGVFCRSLTWVRHSNLCEYPKTTRDPRTKKRLADSESVDYEHNSSSKVGLLLAVLGDRSVALFSIDSDDFDGLVDDGASPFETTIRERLREVKPLWYITPADTTEATQFTCAAAAPLMLETPPTEDATAALRIAVGTSTGTVLVYALTVEGCNVSTAQVYDKTTAITSLSWAPLLTSIPSLLAVGNMTGKVRVWDLRGPLDGLLFEWEGPKRPVHHVSWSPIKRFVLACCEAAVILDSQTKDCHCRAATNRPGVLIKRPQPGVDRPAWCGTTVGDWIVFGFDEGSVFVAAADLLDRRISDRGRGFVWSLSTANAIDYTKLPAPVEGSTEILAKKMLLSSDTSEPSTPAELTDVVTRSDAVAPVDVVVTSPCSTPQIATCAKSGRPSSIQEQAMAEMHDIPAELCQRFYTAAAQFYGASFRCARKSAVLNIKWGVECASLPKATSGSTQRQKHRVPALQGALDSMSASARIHAVAGLDPLIYSEVSRPLIASGGDIGIVHCWNP